MTLLTIAQSIARNAGVAVPDTIIGNEDPTAQKLLAAASLAGRMLARRHDWSDLIREHEFTTVASTGSYALPSDYDHYIDNTAWDVDNYWQMRGGLSPQEWRFQKNVIVTSVGLRTLFRVKWDASASAKRIFLHPVPDAAVDKILEYITNQWCQSSGGTGQTDWAADADVPRIDAFLIELEANWRFRESDGIAYAEQLADADGEIKKAIARDNPAQILNMANEPIDSLVGALNLPETGFGT